MIPNRATHHKCEYFRKINIGENAISYRGSKLLTERKRRFNIVHPRMSSNSWLKTRSCTLQKVRGNRSTAQDNYNNFQIWLLFTSITLLQLSVVPFLSVFWCSYYFYLKNNNKNKVILVYFLPFMPSSLHVLLNIVDSALL